MKETSPKKDKLTLAISGRERGIRIKLERKRERVIVEKERVKMEGNGGVRRLRTGADVRAHLTKLTQVYVRMYVRP